MAYALSVTVDGIPQVRAMLDRNSGRELTRRTRLGVRTGASMLVTPIRSEIRAAGLVQSGAFMRSVSARSLRSGGYDVGPRDYKRHWLIRGTKRGIEPHPVVDRAVGPNLGAVGTRVADVILRGRR